MPQIMMMGVDIGTTSTKAVLFTENGRIVSQHSVEYPIFTPVPGAGEQDPDTIFDAVVTAIRHAVDKAGDAGTISHVAFSAAMHSLIAMDGEDRPLTRSITWMDTRASAWARHLANEMDGHQIYLRTGTPIHPMSPLVKLLWLKAEQPDLFARASRFVGIKEYVFHRLFGRWLVDHSIASATGLFNLADRDWDDGALAAAGIAVDRLSTLVPTTTPVTGLPKAIADQLGLPADTPFIIGANDGVLSNLGVGAIGAGQVAVTIGTSGAMRTVIDQPRTDPSGRTFCYALTDKLWVIGGPVNNGGIVFRWVRDQLAASETETAHRLGVDPYEVLTRIAERVAPGAEGLLFHPYLAGERAPLWNADLRGSFFGLAMHHRREHMIRAVLEGVIFNLYSILPAVESLIGPTRRIMATGGFARSGLWRQMMADIFDREVVVPESFESSCLGAAVLGQLALGRISSLDAVNAMVGATHQHHPDPAAVAVYRQLWPIFAALPIALAEQYSAITEFQRSAPKAG
ncbi:gluconokinase [Telmatospirillum sp.]|uniref:gluconokinase n=1 Tax=Telmatospirillum sp. TaxID=2079197 RepID=UPI00283ED9AE|nr:gluconokinase [Telmatospirillum sp.]MDR3436805.1 gluconokinase [Telmatospirillum sp.]